MTASNKGSVRYLFASISAQPDNLGDVEIRRLALKLLTSKHPKQILYVGAMPQGYLGLFERQKDRKFVSSKCSYLAQLLRRIARRRADLLFAPGPVLLELSARTVAKSLVMCTLALAVRLGGGEVVALGRSLRGDSKIAATLERLLCSISTTYTLRDEISARFLTKPVSVLPDLALASTPILDEGSRNSILLSFRYDRSPDLRLLTGIVQRFRGEGKTIIFASQVRRDDDQHEKLASYFACESLLWGSRNYAEQYLNLLSAYAGADVVFTDRLHVAILSAARGALPYELSSVHTDKIQSTAGIWFDVPVIRNLEDVESIGTSGDRAKSRLKQFDALTEASRLLAKASESYGAPIST